MSCSLSILFSSLTTLTISGFALLLAALLVAAPRPPAPLPIPLYFAFAPPLPLPFGVVLHPIATLTLPKGRRLEQLHSAWSIETPRIGFL